MTDKELATLTRLFRDIESELEKENLTFQFVIDGLQKISKGKEIPTIIYAPGPVGVLVFKHSIAVPASPKTELEFEGGYSRNRGIRGRDMGIRLPRDFEKKIQPETPGGKGAILETLRRATLFDFAQELLKEPITRDFSFETKLFEQGISFSLPQVLNILDNDLAEANKKKSRIFFIHNSESEVCAVSISSKHSQLYPRDWDGAYSYAERTNVIVRNVPEHLQQK